MAEIRLPEYGLYIGGRWVDNAENGEFETINPYTGLPWAIVSDAGVGDVDAAVTAARAALTGPWGQMTGFERARLLNRLASILERDAEQLAMVESRDTGKLLREMVGQASYVPSWLRYFAGVADKLEGKTIPSDKPNYFLYTRREPVGVVAAIVPWNSPLLLTMWKLAPALAAGCTFILKPSDEAPVSALELALRVEEAGLPAGVFNVLTSKGAEAAQALVAHPGVDKVAFTGSPEVGIKVAQAAASHGAPVLLELGGKSAQIVFSDAAIESAVNGVIAGIFAASGQTCVAGSRLLVERTLHDEVVDRLVARASTIKLGDPQDLATEMGPVATNQQLENVLGFIARARSEGANLAFGGSDAERGGLFVLPTVLTNVHSDMEIANREVFGPVLAVTSFETEDEAIQLANGTQYGLAAGVWTRDIHRAHRVAHALQAGTVWINSYRAVAPNAPFGGLRLSGWGRESGIDAVNEYLRTKTVWVELGEQTRDPFVVG